MMPTTINHDAPASRTNLCGAIVALVLVALVRPADAQNGRSFLLADDSIPTGDLQVDSDTTPALAQEIAIFGELVALGQSTLLISAVDHTDATDTVNIGDAPVADSLLTICGANRARVEPTTRATVLALRIHANGIPQTTIKQNAFETSGSERATNLGATVVWSAINSVNLYGSTSWTDFRRDAAISEYVTPTAGIAWRLENGTNISLGVEVDYANSFERQGFSANFTFAF